MKKQKNIYGPPGYDLIKKNEKIIKYSTIFCVVYSIIFIGLMIAWIYCKVKGI